MEIEFIITNILVLVLLPVFLCNMYFLKKENWKGTVRTISFILALSVLLGYLILAIIWFKDWGILFFVIPALLLIASCCGVFFGQGKLRKWCFGIGVFLALLIFALSKLLIGELL